MSCNRNSLKYLDRVKMLFSHKLSVNFREHFTTTARLNVTKATTQKWILYNFKSSHTLFACKSRHYYLVSLVCIFLINIANCIRLIDKRHLCGFVRSLTKPDFVQTLTEHMPSIFEGQGMGLGIPTPTLKICVTIKAPE